MLRKWFFWMEKLQVTPGERRAVSVLLVMLTILTGGRAAVDAELYADEDHYDEILHIYRERTEKMMEEEKKRMERYYPASESVADNQPVKLPADTVTADTVGSIESDQGDSPSQEDITAININTADEETLQELPGVGPVYSRRIVAYREEHDGFNSVEELIEIKGIGEKTLEKLKPLVAID